MVDLVRVNAKKIDLKACNQVLFGLLRFMGGKITVETKRFDNPPNLMIPFDYNLLILVVEHAFSLSNQSYYKIFEIQGTTVNWILVLGK